jgi:hypothetical protein
MSLAERIKLSFKRPPCLVEGNVPLFFLEGIDSPSKPNVALLYWSLPPSVLCQWFRQIMVLRDHSLISLLFSLVKEYGSRMNLEILILHFKNKNYLMWIWNNLLLKSCNSLVIFFLVKEIMCSCVWQWGLRWKYIMRWPFVFLGFQSEGLEKKFEVLYEKNLSLFEHSFLSAWIIIRSLFLMSWILWKVFFAFWEHYLLFYVACLLD